MISKRPVYPLIFTDLDGTLLDHKSYSAKPADLLIQQIFDKSLGYVIPITSKTHAELQSLQRSIPIGNSIGVTENGSVIHIPLGNPFNALRVPQNIVLGIEYAEILNRVAALPQVLRQHILGFADMSAAEVAKVTGLGIDDARLAKERQATEPFLWSGSSAELIQLQTIMSDVSIKIQRGGRFYHFTGDATKERAMSRIRGLFADRQPEYGIISIALGDGPNDLGMIEAADIGVIMPNSDGVTIESTHPDVRTAPAPGPRGWAMAVREIFAELGLILAES